MKVAYKQSIASRIEQCIEAMPYNVILREDVKDLAKPRQLSYALNRLIQAKKLVRIAYGVYTKVKTFEWNGEEDILLRSPHGFTGVVRETLDRLAIPWQPSQAEEDYNNGKSTQVPVRMALRIVSRFRRKITYKNMVFKPQKAA